MIHAPPTRPATDASVCGARECYDDNNLQLVRPGDGYQRVLCRRHATEFLGMQRWST